MKEQTKERYRFNIISEIARRKESSYINFFDTENQASEWKERYEKEKSFFGIFGLLYETFETQEQADKWVAMFNNTVPVNEHEWTGIFKSYQFKSKTADINHL